MLSAYRSKYGHASLCPHTAEFGLYFYNARYYDPAVGRFAQPDTLVPEPGNPQDLNRYTYTRNNPLKYVDPSGHDLMVIGGGNDWNDPGVWKDWVMAYTGWTEQEWYDHFYTPWMTEGANRQQIMADTGVHIMNWEGIGADPDSAATTGDLTRTAASLDRQWQGMKDIVLLGHSRGGKVIEWYLGAYNQRTARVPAAILIESPTSFAGEVVGTAGGRHTWPPNAVFGRDAWPIPFVQRSETAIVTINNVWFPFGGGLISGSENFQTLAVDGGAGPASTHGLKNYLAGPVFSFLRGQATPTCGGPWPWLRFPVPLNPAWFY